jgi:hypothetical protein
MDHVHLRARSRRLDLVHLSSPPNTGARPAWGLAPMGQATSASGVKLAAFGMTAAGSVPIQLPSSSV